MTSASVPVAPEDLLKQGCERPWEVAIDPFEVAPDTYYVGNSWVGAYLLKTSEGLVLIDTTMQPQVYLVFESIRKLGFDPRDITHILLSHGHYDHIGGAKVLKEHSGARVYMSREDWAFISERPEQVFNFGYPYAPLEPDGFYGDNTPLLIGDRTIRTVLTPGHTPGTTSFFFDAVGGDGTRYRCGLHGGVGLNTLADDFLSEFGFPKTVRDTYLASMLKVRGLNVEIALGSHPDQIGMLEKIGDIRPGHNPFHDPSVWTDLIDGRVAQVKKLMEDAK